MKSELYIQTPNNQVEGIDAESQRPAPASKRSNRCSLQLSGPIDTEEIRPASSSKESTESSLPVDIDRMLHVGINREADTVSTDFIERLILLTSNSRSWHASDDEPVDLTEPRFESFRVANKTLWQKLPDMCRRLKEKREGKKKIPGNIWFMVVQVC